MMHKNVFVLIFAFNSLLLRSHFSAVATANLRNQTKVLKLGYLIAWSHDWPIGPSTGSAIVVALQEVKERRLLDGYEVEWMMADTYCQAKQGIISAVSLYSRYEDLDAYIGASCSIVCVPQSLLAAAKGIPVVSYSCASDTLSDKDMYPTFSRVTGLYSSLSVVFNSVCETFNWNRIGIISDIVDLYINAAKDTKKAMENSGRVVFHYTLHSTITADATSDNLRKMRQVIKLLASQTKIILILMYSLDVRNILIIAQEEGLYPKNLYFFGADHAPMLTATDFDYLPNIGPELFDGFIDISPSQKGGLEWNHFRQKVIDEFQLPVFDSWSHLPANATIDMVDAYAGLMHDAVLLWAYGVNKTLEQGSSPHDGFKVAKNMFNMSFQGITGTVTIDEKGDRKPNYIVIMVQNLKLLPLMEWIANEDRLEKIYKADKPGDWSGLQWPGNESTVPQDSHCGWKGELCGQDDRRHITTTIYSMILVVVILVAVIAITAGVRRMRFEQALKDAQGYCIAWKDIQIVKSLVSLVSFQSISSSTSSRHQANTETGNVRNIQVAIKRLGGGTVSITDRNVLLELKAMKEIHHENINPFVGVCLERPHACVLMTYAPRGSLYDILHDDNITLSWDFKQSLLTDVAMGMNHLHSGAVESHGHLTTSNCVVNSRWTCQITDYGLTYLKQRAKSSPAEELRAPWQLLWTAPELLLCQQNGRGTRKGDVYSFAMIGQEVVLQDLPFACNNPVLTPSEIVERVKSRENPPFRPFLSPDSCRPAWKDMIVQAWHDDEDQRPTFSGILTMIKHIGGGTKPSLVDSMINRLEFHTKHLEEIVEERSRELAEERIKMEVILQDLLPALVADKLKNGFHVEPESFDNVTLFFSDIVSFTRISAAGTPVDVVKMLNFMYTVFDDIAAEFDVYKVATIGDAYFVASGVPTKNGDRHAVEICSMALRLMQGILDCPIPHMPKETLKMRIGIHTGPCVAGVAGMKMPRYLLFGETVDATTSMEAMGESMRIHISATTKSLLDKTEAFLIEERGKMYIKGLGETTTYWLID